MPSPGNTTTDVWELRIGSSKSVLLSDDTVLVEFQLANISGSVFVSKAWETPGCDIARVSKLCESFPEAQAFLSQLIVVPGYAVEFGGT